MPCSIPVSSARCRRPSKRRELVENAIAEAYDYQEALDRARIVGREQGFLIGVRVISGTISARQAGAAYATLAETLIEALADRVEAELVRQHGRMPGGQAAVLAMGKLGGREMTASSDLDLIMVYDFDGDAAQSDGPKQPARQPILHALHPAPDRRAVGADRRRLALSGRYAAQALRQSGAGGDQACELHRLSAGLGLDLGASGADPRARRLRPDRPRASSSSATISEVLRRPRDRAHVAADVRDHARQDRGGEGDAPTSGI